MRQSDAVTLIDANQRTRRTAVLEGHGIRYSAGDAGRTADLHPQWLRERSQEPGQVEPTNRQRLFTPTDVAHGLHVTGCEQHDDRLVVHFSDGHNAALDVDAIERALGWADDPEQPPTRVAWTRPLDVFPYVDWAAIGWSRDGEDHDAVIDFLTAFYRHGYAVLRNTPVEPGTLRRIADRLGYISGNNFGWIFDVRAEPKPTDLAYTAIELLAHTDQPYRQPIPGIQMLHCLRNEAPGGDSTLVDGLAAAEAIAAAEPDLHRALVETEVEWRYDMGSDTVVGRGHILEYDRFGRYRRIRFNTKLDAPVPRPGADLDGFYDGRRWLTHWLNNPEHQVTFRLEPGDVMFMDNHRALHGRTAFDASLGHRHLQGAYIDHDGPDTMYRLAIRRRTAQQHQSQGAGS